MLLAGMNPSDVEEIPRLFHDLQGTSLSPGKTP